MRGALAGERRSVKQYDLNPCCRPAGCDLCCRARRVRRFRSSPAEVLLKVARPVESFLEFGGNAEIDRRSGLSRLHRDDDRIGGIG